MGFFKDLGSLFTGDVSKQIIAREGELSTALNARRDIDAIDDDELLVILNISNDPNLTDKQRVEVVRMARERLREIEKRRR